MSPSSAAVTPACRRPASGGSRHRCRAAGSRARRLGSVGAQWRPLHSGQRRDSGLAGGAISARTRPTVCGRWPRRPRRSRWPYRKSTQLPATGGPVSSRRPTSKDWLRDEIAYANKASRRVWLRRGVVARRAALSQAIGTDVYFGGGATRVLATRSPEVRARAGACGGESRRPHLRGHARVRPSEPRRPWHRDRLRARHLANQLRRVGFSCKRHGTDRDPRRQRLSLRHRAGGRGAGHAHRQLHRRYGADRRRAAGRAHPWWRGSLRHALRGSIISGRAPTGGSSRRRRGLRCHGRGAVAALVRKHLARIYRSSPMRRRLWPGAARWQSRWSACPNIRRVRPGVYAAAGYSGQGVAIAPSPARCWPTPSLATPRGWTASPRCRYPPSRAARFSDFRRWSLP